MSQQVTKHSFFFSNNDDAQFLSFIGSVMPYALDTTTWMQGMQFDINDASWNLTYQGNESILLSDPTNDAAIIALFDNVVALNKQNGTPMAYPPFRFQTTTTYESIPLS